MSKDEIIEYLYEHNVRGDLTIEQMAEDLADRKTEPQRNMAEDIVRSFGFKAESYRQAKAKDEPQTERHLPDYSYEADLGRRIMEQTERSNDAE